jgi:hypothetical protein
MFDWCPDGVFVVAAAADATDRSCKEKQQMINQVLCITRIMFFLLIPMLPITGSFCAVFPVLHDCSLCNLLGLVIPCLAGRSFSRLGPSLSCFSGHSDGYDHPHTTGSRWLLAVHSDMAQTLTIVALCKLILESVSFDIYNYITVCCQFEEAKSKPKSKLLYG